MPLFRFKKLEGFKEYDFYSTDKNVSWIAEEEGLSPHFGQLDKDRVLRTARDSMTIYESRSEYKAALVARGLDVRDEQGPDGVPGRGVQLALPD